MPDLVPLNIRLDLLSEVVGDAPPKVDGVRLAERSYYPRPVW